MCMALWRPFTVVLQSVCRALKAACGSKQACHSGFWAAQMNVLGQRRIKLLGSVEQV